MEQPALKGAIAELIAANWYMEQGLQVFRNLSPSGPVDLIVMDPVSGRTELVDVKSSPLVPRAGSVSVHHIVRPTTRQQEMNVQLLHVHEGRVLGYTEQVEQLNARLLCNREAVKPQGRKGVKHK